MFVKIEPCQSNDWLIAGSKPLCTPDSSLHHLRHALAPLKPHSGARRMFVRWLYYNVFVDFDCNIDIVGKMLYVCSLCTVFIDSIWFAIFYILIN